MDGDLPGHLRLEDKHAWLGIMSVEGLKRQTQRGSWKVDDAKTYEIFQSKVKTALTNASPKSFKPDLDQLDAFVRSIELH